MEHFAFPAAQRRRALSSAVLSITCFVLFSLFLLAGFWGAVWLLPAWGALAALCLAWLVHGILSARLGAGVVEVGGETIRFWSGPKKSVTLRFDGIRSARFIGSVFPRLILHGEGGTIVIGKTLPHYPRLWTLLRLRIPYDAKSAPQAVRIGKAEHLWVFSCLQALLLAAATAVVLFFARGQLGTLALVLLLALFAGVFALCFAFSFARLGAVRFGETHIELRTFFRRHAVEVSSIRCALLSQENTRLLVTGYRSRGPAMTTRATLSPAAPVLALTLSTGGESILLDDTMTAYPIELLFEQLLTRYRLAGEIADK